MVENGVTDRLRQGSNAIISHLHKQHYGTSPTTKDKNSTENNAVEVEVSGSIRIFRKPSKAHAEFIQNIVWICRCVGRSASN